MSVAQAKTGRRIWLPLLKDVGWAVIDYVRSGRPASGCPQVFLRHAAPIGPFSDQEHLHQMLVKHARAAHVRVSGERRHGMRSLRHTLAARLMEDGTPAGQIAGILGHQPAASAGVYLKSSLGLLSRCALDPDAIAEGQAAR
ncbi:MAG: tyrosine-type recombinase/integrase [Streptosporangiaceae bacterium]